MVPILVMNLAKIISKSEFNKVVECGRGFPFRNLGLEVILLIVWGGLLPG